ncbi:SDR family NAD(P)-dependent oxidoreductase [Microcella sp.]|uniref:SDR family NAD(P)-dependent oxidoreductase n=1 Tax=Microcella sp. TaxID=1913979 RepID=UPI002565DBDD|nr:SDR family NAD(P)-dependent oxidoreductase [Microcella sp.]MBX9472373.1 SDR family NAD(P)-dependent oxidoreductase [Microcella sp.]
MQLGGDVVIVTGAGAGMGREHALLLGSLGARVVVNDVGVGLQGQDLGERPADEVVRLIVEAGGEAVADENSVATEEGADRLVRTALDTFGRVDAVVNNAGILRDRTFGKMSMDELRAVLEVHLVGSFLVTQKAWPHFRSQGYGRVVMTTSGAGLYGNFGQANYAAAKMGMVGLARTLAVEGARDGIKANSLSPAARTRMSNDTLEEEFAQALDPALVSPVVALMVSRECPWTGQTIAAGGGRVALVNISETPGYVNTRLTVDDLIANLDKVHDEAGSFTPDGVPAQADFLLAQIKAGAA